MVKSAYIHKNIFCAQMTAIYHSITLSGLYFDIINDSA